MSDSDAPVKMLYLPYSLVNETRQDDTMSHADGSVGGGSRAHIMKEDSSDTDMPMD